MNNTALSTDALRRAAGSAISPQTHIGWLGRWLPEPTGRWFARRYLRPDRSHATREDEIALRDKVSPLGLKDLWVAEIGEGPTVLFVHGWGYRGTRFLPLVEPIVAAGYRAVLLDLPAHGRSAGETVTPHEAARAVLRVGEVTGPIHGVVGHSFGGAVGAIAMVRGLPAARLVMVGSPSSYRRSFVHVMDRLGLAGPAQDFALRELEARVGGLEDVDMAVAGRAVGDRPLLVVHDPLERDVPIRDALRNAQVWPNSTLIQLEGAGHTMILHHPKTRDAILNHLA